MEKSKLKKVDEVINQGLQKSQKTTNVTSNAAPRGAGKKSKKATKPFVKAYRRKMKLTHLSSWAKSLARPFDVEAPICPVSFNPAPSLSVLPARLTTTLLNFSVAAGSTIQHTMFPGHGTPVSNVQDTLPGTVGSDMDAVAYHARGNYTPIASGGIADRVCVGPVGYVIGGHTYAPFCVTASLLAHGGATNGTASTSYPLLWDVPLPYSSDISSGASHLRWQLVSCGVRLFNTTPVLARGGNVVTVQMINSAGVVRANGANATGQSELEYNPSFQVHGDCSDGIELSWIPRTQDLAYWHNLNSNVATEGASFNAANFAGCGFCLFFNNQTGTAQTYSAQYVFNFMLSGNLIQSVSRESVSEPSLKSPIEQTVVHLQNTSATAREAPVFAAASSLGDTGQTMSEKVAEIGSRLYKAGQETVFSLAAGATHAILQNSHRPTTYGGGILVPRR